MSGLLHRIDLDTMPRYKDKPKVDSMGASHLVKCKAKRDGTITHGTLSKSQLQAALIHSTSRVLVRDRAVSRLVEMEGQMKDVWLLHVLVHLYRMSRTRPGMHVCAAPIMHERLLHV